MRDKREAFEILARFLTAVRNERSAVALRKRARGKRLETLIKREAAAVQVRAFAEAEADAFILYWGPCR